MLTKGSATSRLLIAVLIGYMAVPRVCLFHWLRQGYPLEYPIYSPRVGGLQFERAPKDRSNLSCIGPSKVLVSILNAQSFSCSASLVTKRPLGYRRLEGMSTVAAAARLVLGSILVYPFGCGRTLLDGDGEGSE